MRMETVPWDRNIQQPCRAVLPLTQKHNPNCHGPTVQPWAGLPNAWGSLAAAQPSGSSCSHHRAPSPAPGQGQCLLLEQRHWPPTNPYPTWIWR